MIIIKTPQQIEELKASGAVSKLALRRVGAAIRPGVSTLELDQIAESVIRMHGAIPTFKGYQGFPGSICASVNDEVVHGIPSADVRLSEGDIVSIDTGATVNGWAGDNAWTFYVGEPSDEAKALCEVTRDCLKASIAQAVPGNHIGDIGYACQSLAEKHGYGVLRDYVGHGVGRDMHEDPNVPNYGKRGRGVRLQVGMVLAIEFFNDTATTEIYTAENGWTVSTADGLLSAHFENTIAITQDGPVVVSADADGPWCSMYGGQL